MNDNAIVTLADDRRAEEPRAVDVPLSLRARCAPEPRTTPAVTQRRAAG